MPKKSPTRTKPLPTLREHAEAAAHASRTAIDRMTREDVLRLVDELQVHQIELEMQNEELRRAQSELAHSRDRFNDLYDFAPVGYVTLDHDATTIEANLTLATMLGVERQKLVGHNFTRFVARATQDALYLHQRALLDDGQKQTCELLLRRADGTKFFARMETIATTDATTGARVGRSAIIDITEHIRAEEVLARFNATLEQQVKERAAALGESEGRLAGMLRLSFDAIIVWRLDGAIESWNQGAEQLYGYHECEALGRVTHELFGTSHPKPWREIKAMLRKCGNWEGELRHRTRDGREVTVSARHQLVVGADGIERVLETNRDITARKSAEEALRRNEALLRSITDHTEDIIAIKDREGRYLFTNPAGCRAGGFTMEEIIGHTDVEFHANREEALRFMADDRRVMESRQPEIFEEEFTTRRGERCVLQTNKMPRFDAEGRVIGVIIVCRDITERKRLETEVLRISEDERQRVSADLHDGICQELVGIQFLSVLLLRDLEKAGSPLAAQARRIEEALIGTTEHARQVARGLSPVVSDGRGLMYALRQLAETTASVRRIRCVFDCPTPVSIESPVTANELYRIAQEAILNAVRHSGANRITVRLSESDGGICVAVSDNGHGLPAKASNANGMGVRIMRYRADLIGGRLTIQPRRRGGTEIICRLAPPSTTTR